MFSIQQNVKSDTALAKVSVHFTRRVQNDALVFKLVSTVVK